MCIRDRSWERWYICPTVCGGALPARAPALTPTERISSPSPRARCRRPEVAGRSVRSSRSCGSLFVTLMDCSLKALIMIDSTAVSYTHLRAHETVLDLV